MKPSRIRILPDSLINKIAAGEVVERPASVVKELVENSIDAQAKRISIEIEMGGVRLVKVTDDGIGMTPDEALISLTRHATSKISSVDDLFAISTLGFRGEALPSIASVSLFELITRSADFADGARIRMEDGSDALPVPHGCPVGTKIEVRELFHNLPARRKFLKSITTETRQVIAVTTALSLAHERAGFRLVSDGRVVIDLQPADSLAQRVCDVYGEELFRRFITFNDQSDPLHLTGFLSIPSDAKRHRMEAYFFVNRRPVSSRLVHAAVMSAYGELLPKGCYPQGALYIDVAPDAVDVNVSPTKSEVRFKDERALYHVVYHAVQNAVRQPDVIPGISASDTGSPAGTEARQSRLKSAVDAFHKSHVPLEVTADQTAIELAEKGHTTPTSRSDTTSDDVANAETDQVVSTRDTRQSNGATLESRRPYSLAPYRVVGFGDLYLIAFSGEAIYIVDQHAAHERILYEKALASFDQAAFASQKLLFPINVELDAASFQVATSTVDDLNRLGFEVRPFGLRSVAIYAMPAAAGASNPERLYRSMIDDLAGVEMEGENLHKKMAQSFACRAAVMAGDRLTDEEKSALISDLFLCQNPYVCPHGRPTLIKLTKSELEKRFGR